MTLATYILSYISFSMFVTGILFKVMHWPGSSFMLVASYPFIILTATLMLVHKISEDNKTK